MNRVEPAHTREELQSFWNHPLAVPSEESIIYTDRRASKLKFTAKLGNHFSMFNLRISGLCVDNCKGIIGVFLSKIARKRTNILKLEERKAIYYLSAPENIHLTCFFRLHQICRLQLKTLDILSHNTITSITWSNANVKVSSSLIGSSSNSG